MGGLSGDYGDGELVDRVCFDGEGMGMLWEGVGVGDARVGFMTNLNGDDGIVMVILTAVAAALAVIHSHDTRS